MSTRLGIYAGLAEAATRDYEKKPPTAAAAAFCWRSVFSPKTGDVSQVAPGCFTTDLCMSGRTALRVRKVEVVVVVVGSVP